MIQLLNAELGRKWSELSPGLSFRTPDNINGSDFLLSSVTPVDVVITTSGGLPIKIQREAFSAALEYLETHQHNEHKRRCDINANKVSADAGPLCVCARNANGSDTMIISYVLPILESMGFVGIDGERPNGVWLT